jgi:phosphatidylglycerophosphatase C
LNVYDFDNTIYRGESGASLFFFYLRKDPKLLRKIPWGLKLIIKYKTGKMTLQQVLDTYSDEIVSYGSSLANFDKDMVKFWDMNGHKIKPFYLKQRKDDDVILSACPDVVIGEICRRLHISRFVATETEAGTMRLIRFCYRENKVIAFKEKYPDAVIDNFYTDSYNDSAMFEMARNVYLVKGSKMKKIK